MIWFVEASYLIISRPLLFCLIFFRYYNNKYNTETGIERNKLMLFIVCILRFQR